MAWSHPGVGAVRSLEKKLCKPSWGETVSVTNFYLKCSIKIKALSLDPSVLPQNILQPKYKPFQFYSHYYVCTHHSILLTIHPHAHMYGHIEWYTHRHIYMHTLTVRQGRQGRQAGRRTVTHKHAQTQTLTHAVTDTQTDMYSTHSMAGRQEGRHGRQAYSYTHTHSCTHIYTQPLTHKHSHIHWYSDILTDRHVLHTQWQAGRKVP